MDAPGRCQPRVFKAIATTMVASRFAVLLFACLAFASSPAAAQVVQGTVVDLATGQGVPSALVELLGEGGGADAVARVSSDGEGRFTLGTAATGTYRLRASRIGYETVTTDRFDLVEGDRPFQVEIRVGAEAVPLEPMHVLSDRPARLHPGLYMRGFYDRRGTWGREGMGFGHFFDREDIERRNPFQVTDMLLDVPGVRVEFRGNRSVQITLRSVTSLGDASTQGRRCVPTIFVDGAPAASGDPGDGSPPLNTLVSVADLAGVEVYPGLTAPARFIRGACGSVVLWTGGRSSATIGDLQEFAAHARAPISIELRAGPGIGDFAPTGSGLHWAPRVGGSLTVEWLLFSRVGVYGGMSRTAFGCERELCQDEEVGFVSRGIALGLRGALGVPGGPWLRLGATRHRLRWTLRDPEDTQEGSTGAALGIETAAGATVPLGRRFALTPGARFVRYATPEKVRLVTLDLGFRMEF